MLKKLEKKHLSKSIDEGSDLLIPAWEKFKNYLEQQTRMISLKK